jgi:N-acetyl-beta-hexosaminidase
VMVDTARALVTPHQLLDAVQTARFYKIRYLHLHMTDDHAWTFPSAAFPLLGTANIGFRGRTPKVR